MDVMRRTATTVATRHAVADPPYEFTVRAAIAVGVPFGAVLYAHLGTGGVIGATGAIAVAALWSVVRHVRAEIDTERHRSGWMIDRPTSDEAYVRCARCGGYRHDNPAPLCVGCEWAREFVP